MEKRSVAVGMSGGVDSSVAALLLKQAGSDVTGVTMRIYAGRPASGPVIDSCYGPGEEGDIEDARRVCATLGIPHHVVDLRDEYRAFVLDHARSEYLAGRTPNPCVRCNQKVKFGLLLEKLSSAHSLSFDAFATGHYCRVVRLANGRFALRTAADASKDQTYFLCMLTQGQLARVIFPLGDMTKSETRARAREAGLENHDRPESQDFAAGGYRAVMSAPEREGPIKDPEGRVIGMHKGVWSYTIGQRRGLGVGGGAALYVTALDAPTNTVTAGPDSALYRSELVATEVNWASMPPAEEPLRFSVKIRYRNAAAPALVIPLGTDSVRVVFDEPQRAIAPGQWAVFYDRDILAGGGLIQ